LESKSHPRIITWLAFGTFTFSILFITRFFLSFDIPDLPIQVPPWYLSLTGFIWGLVGLVLSFALFRTFPWALHLLRWGSLCFVGWYWIDRLLFARSDYSRVTWPASIILTIIYLAGLYWFQRNPDVQMAFQVKKD